MGNGEVEGLSSLSHFRRVPIIKISFTSKSFRDVVLLDTDSPRLHDMISH